MSDFGSVETTTTRAPSIRFKLEPSEELLEEERFVRHEPKDPGKMKKPSSLKGSKTKVGRSHKATSEVIYYKSPSIPSSIESSSPAPPPTDPQLLGAVSISLEDVALPGDSGSGFGSIRRRDSDSDMRTPKSWSSFDDLSVIKRELSEPMSPVHDQARIEILECIPKRTSVIIQSPRHRSVIEGLRLTSMTKDDVVSMWRTSERELLSELHNLNQQKRALEEKVALLQRMLMKPP